MDFIDKIKQDIQSYFGSRGTITEHQPNVTGNLRDLKSIALFFCIQTKEELMAIRKLLKRIRERNDMATAYVFARSRERLDVITDPSIVYFDLNDFSLFGTKNEQLKALFDKARPELLISFLADNDRFCYKLASEIHAGFKVGPKMEGPDQIYNLILDMNDKPFDFIDFYEQTRHYLSILNIKTT